LAILVTPWVLGGRLGLPIWYFPLILGVLGVTVLAVLRGWHWWVRLPLHAAWIALQVAEQWFEYRY
jgi:hypothetical protein